MGSQKAAGVTLFIDEELEIDSGLTRRREPGVGLLKMPMRVRAFRQVGMLQKL